MRERWWVALPLFTSAYAPLLIFLAIPDFDFQNYSGFKHPWAAFVLIGCGIFLPFSLIPALRVRRKNFQVEIKNVQDRSNEVLNYSLPYIVSFIGIELDKPEKWIPFSLFMLLLFILSWRTQSLFINPILIIFGFRYFEVDMDENNQLKHRLLLIKGIPRIGQWCNITPLNSYLYLGEINEDKQWVQASKT